MCIRDRGAIIEERVCDCNRLADPESVVKPTTAGSCNRVPIRSGRIVLVERYRHRLEGVKFNDAIVGSADLGNFVVRSAVKPTDLRAIGRVPDDIVQRESKDRMAFVRSLFLSL